MTKREAVELFMKHGMIEALPIVNALEELGLLKFDPEPTNLWPGAPVLLLFSLHGTSDEIGIPFFNVVQRLEEEGYSVVPHNDRAFKFRGNPEKIECFRFTQEMLKK